MLDVQRRRLQHLMANAILELWKKETGSLSSVIIEGTICITSSNGQTTVVQVDDRFNSAMPENSFQDDAERINGVGTSVITSPRETEDAATSMDLSTSHKGSLSSGTGYSSDLTPPSLSEQQQRHSPDFQSSLDRRSQSHVSEPQRQNSTSSDQVFYSNNNKTCSNNNNETDSDSDIEIGQEICEPSLVKSKDNYPPPEELSSSGYSSVLGRSSYLGSSVSSNKSELRSPEEVSCRTGLTPLRRRSASPTLLMMDSPSISTSTPKDATKRPRLDMVRARSEEIGIHVKSEPDEPDTLWSGSRVGQRSRSGSILDLSGQRDAELALSDPHNYTAQVRHVIRQRLLANRGPSNGDCGEESSKPADNIPSSSRSTPVAPVPTTHTGTVGDTTSTSLPYLISTHAIPDRPSTDSRSDSWDEKVPLLPPSGPASWPTAANQDKAIPPVPLGDAKFFLPGHFSHLLSIGVPGPHSPLPGLPSSLSPALFHGNFPGFVGPHPRLPLPPGISIQDFANLSKQPLVSPGTLAGGPQNSLSSVISSMPSAERDANNRDSNNDARSYTSTQASERSTPEVGTTDINGNSEKEVTTNGDQKVYICEYCNKHFLFKSKYHEHLPVHTNARPYQCHLCSRTYKYKYDLQVHLRTHMGIPTKSTICPFCSGKFNTNKMLRNHIIEAHQDRQKVTKEECTTPGDNLPPAL